MGSDDDKDFSIHDLENVPEISMQMDDRRGRRYRSFSDGHVVRLPMTADECSHENRFGRARVWSSGSGSSSFHYLLSPDFERKPPRTKSFLSRKSISKSLSEPGEAIRIPEEDLLSEDVSSGSLSNDEESIHFPRLSLSSHNKSNAILRSDSENSTRQSLNKFTQPEITELHSSRIVRVSPTNESYEDEGEDSSAYADHYSERDGRTHSSGKQPILWGVELPRCFSKKRPSWNRVAAFVVIHAPCFWCFRLTQKTDRAIVQRLNILCAFFALFQALSAVLVFVYLNNEELAEHDVPPYDPTGELTGPDSSQRKFKLISHIWNINGALFGLGIISFIVFAATIITVPVVRNVNLLGAIRYLWILMWIIPFQIYFVIGLFDYFRVTRVWVQHWWRDESLAAFREAFCEPSSTYNTLCAAPEVENVTSWCLLTFNSTDCGRIREKAQDDLDKFMISYYYGCAIWAMLLTLLLMLVVHILESIISRPLVQKSRESNVPAWFSIPILGCLVNGLLFIFSTSSDLVSEADRSSAFWVGPMYVATGGLFLLAAGLGWFISSYSILNTRDKKYKMLAVNLFVIVIAIVFISLIYIIGGSIAFSISLIDQPLSDEARGNIACFLDQANTCTGCDEDPTDVSSTRCPQWTTDDVTKILQSQAKSSASFAAIFLLFALSAMRFGFNTRRYIRLYQIDYI